MFEAFLHMKIRVWKSEWVVFTYLTVIDYVGTEFDFGGVYTLTKEMQNNNSKPKVIADYP